MNMPFNIKDLKKLDKERKKLANSFMEGADEYAQTYADGTIFHRYLYDWTKLKSKDPWLRSVEGEDHTLFVIDIDIAGKVGIEKIIEECKREKIPYPTNLTPAQSRIVKLAVSSKITKNILNNELKGLNFFMKLSGSSFHLVQKYQKRVSPHSFEPIFDNLFSNWAQTSKFYYKVYDIRGKKYAILIDKVGTHFKHLFTGPYSDYFKEPGTYLIPVFKKDFDDPETILRESRIENLRLVPVKIPPLDPELEKMIDEEKSFIEPQKQHRKKRVHAVKMQRDLKLIPYTDYIADQEDIMEEKIIGSERACVVEAYRRAKEESGIFFERSVIARFLYWEHTKDLDLIARFFYDKVNDEADNTPDNWHKMVNGLYYSIYTRDGKAKYKDTWLSENIIRNKLCNKECNTCTEFMSKTKFKGGEDWEKVYEKVRKIIAGGNHSEIWKTTRVGVTTATVLEAVKANRKILVVEPTNKICEEVFTNIYKRAKEKGFAFKGAVVGANMKICLKCIQEIEEARKESGMSGSQVLEMMKLPFLLKGNCISSDETQECPYYDSVFPNGMAVTPHGDETPLIECDLHKQICALATILQFLPFYDVVFITYDKLRILFQQVFSSPFESLESNIIIDEFLSRFDIVLMDEISRFINSPIIELPLYLERYRIDQKTYKMTREKTVIKDVFKNIMCEEGTEREFLENYIINKGRKPSDNLIIKILDEFLDKFGNVLDRFPENTWGKILNPINPELQYQIQERFSAWYSLIVKLSKPPFNRYLRTITTIMQILSHKEVFITNITNERDVNNIVMKIAPDYNGIIEFVQAFAEMKGKQLLITDATMPLITMKSLFNVDFQLENVGDPRGTCDKQLIIPDTQSITPRQIIATREDYYKKKQLIKFINSLSETHGSKNIMIVSQNKDVARYFLHLQKKGDIPDTFTYYRSADTIGVESDYRIMLVVGAPFPPKNAYNWLAYVFQERGLFPHKTLEELNEELWWHETKSAFFQAIGRSKDPDVKENSLVYCFGIPQGTLMTLLELPVPIPKIYKLAQVNRKQSHLIGKLWKEKGFIVHGVFFKLMEKMIQKDVKKIDKRRIPHQFRSEHFLHRLRMVPDEAYIFFNTLPAFKYSA